jgi:hypothetical protein
MYAYIKKIYINLTLKKEDIYSVPKFMKYLTKYFISYKNLKETENNQEKLNEKSKYQSELEKYDNLFYDILKDDEEKNIENVNFEFDDQKINENIDDLEEILKFESFFNERILDLSNSVCAISRASSIDITNKNIVDEVFNNLNNDKEKKDMLEYDRYTQSFCEDMIEAFENHFDHIIQNSEIHNKYNQIIFNEFNDDKKDRFCRFCVIKKVKINKIIR